MSQLVVSQLNGRAQGSHHATDLELLADEELRGIAPLQERVPGETRGEAGEAVVFNGWEWGNL